MSYEGYAPGGIAIFVECLSDNTNRTVADVRHAFSKYGGNLGTSGSVAYLFERKGKITLDAGDLDEDDIFLLVAEAGAEDLSREGDRFVVTTPLEQFGAVQDALEADGIEPDEAELVRIPTTTTALGEDERAKVVRLVKALDELQDVQNVFTSLDADEGAFAVTSDSD
jgi:YebC/PmpR family DNA-binding regulatory protein